MVACSRQKMLQLSVNIVCFPVAQNTCRVKFLWFKLVKKSERRKILNNKLPLLLDKMASASGSEEYKDLKKKVMEQKKHGKEVSPGDMYKLASLMARWAATDRLPICLLCRKLGSKPEGLGHIIPHSVLKEAGREKFFDHVRGAERGVSNFGYYAFCKVCEKVFQQGEVRPFLANVDGKFQKNVKNDGFPWLYHCLISIIWRLLCFTPENSKYIEALEYLRIYLLNWEADPGEIDKRVKLCLFAPNCDIDEMLKGNEVNRRFFYQFFAGTIFSLPPDFPKVLPVWFFCGPLHVNMLYGSVEILKAVCSSTKGLEDSFLTTKTNQFTIEDKKTRIFPAVYYESVVRFGTSIASAITRLPSAGKKADNTSPVLKPDYFHLLPKDVSYDSKLNNFHFSKDRFEKKGCHHRDAFSITEVKRKGNNEKIVFVAIRGGLKNGGEFAMGLNVNSDGTVEYMKGVNIPPKNAVIGVDLSVPPFKDEVEELLKVFNVVGEIG